MTAPTAPRYTPQRYRAQISKQRTAAHDTANGAAFSFQSGITAGMLSVAADHIDELNALLDVLATVLAAPTNRFGCPEFLADEPRAARETIRIWAVEYGVTGQHSVLHQAAAVVRAFQTRQAARASATNLGAMDG